MVSKSRVRARLGLTQLEAREVPSAVPTVAEQVFLERLNDARADPASYGSQIGVDLSYIAASDPLAFDERLIEAARLHSQDMNGNRFFSHTGSDGSSPFNRMNYAGYSYSAAAESIAAGYSTPDAALSALIIDAGVPSLGHRNHLLANGSSYQHREVGIGIVQNGGGPYQHYYTIDSGRNSDTRPYLTGVVFDDTNGSGRYDAGEGLSGVTITVDGVGSVAVWDTGGYSFRVDPGTYTVTASGGGLAAPVTWTVNVGSSNYRLNFNPGTGDPVSPPPVADVTGPQGTAAGFWDPASRNLSAARVVFSEAIDPSSFDASDIRLTGPSGDIAVTGVYAVEGAGNTQFDFTFDPQTAAGQYTMVIGPDILDAAGNPMDQNQNGANGEYGADEFTYSVALAAAPTATFAWADAATQGSWIGTYGSAGYSLARGASSLPEGVSVTPSGHLNRTWASSTADVRALQKPGSTSRLAGAWYSTTSFTVDVAADGTQYVSLYFLDWQRRGFVQQVEVLDPVTGDVLDTQTVSGFGDGTYLAWQVTGPVQFRLTPITGANAVLSGVFLDPVA